MSEYDWPVDQTKVEVFPAINWFQEVFFCAKRVQDDLRDLRLREFFSQIQWDTVLDHAKEIRPSDENCCENIFIREAEKCFFFADIHQHVLIFTTPLHSVLNLC